ncbi:MAG: hypothetical protein ACRDSL_22775 [Pseudonocardiaceae bacterium]
MAALPRWEEPLSTIQNTRSAEAYGSVVTRTALRRIGRTLGIHDLPGQQQRLQGLDPAHRHLRR